MLLGALMPTLSRASRCDGPHSCSWKALQAPGKKPTVVEFTATWCAHCPAVFERLADWSRTGA